MSHYFTVGPRWRSPRAARDNAHVEPGEESHVDTSQPPRGCRRGRRTWRQRAWLSKIVRSKRSRRGAYARRARRHRRRGDDGGTARQKALIRLSYRPPNYESPLDYFRTPITPNDEFFVRYHLSNIPEVDAATYKIAVGGDGANGQTELTLDDLKKLPAYEIVAVNQCAGNRRGLSNPHVAGVEWGYGAMGCARWKGARLKDVLDKVGLKPEAIEIAFNGADGPAFDKTPDFIKSLPVWKASDESTLIVYEMNGEPLPHFNGFPARLVVPGWTGTYWMKHLVSITALTKPQGGFWMNPAYRIPVGMFPVVSRFTSQENATSTPITEMVVNSLITSHADGAAVKAGKLAVSGLAWDGGYGIRTVEGSTDGGKTWSAATLG